MRPALIFHPRRYATYRQKSQAINCYCASCQLTSVVGMGRRALMAPNRIIRARILVKVNAPFRFDRALKRLTDWSNMLTSGFPGAQLCAAFSSLVVDIRDGLATVMNCFALVTGCYSVLCSSIWSKPAMKHMVCVVQLDRELLQSVSNRMAHCLGTRDDGDH